jgi:hypothetical protein
VRILDRAGLAHRILLAPPYHGSGKARRPWNLGPLMLALTLGLGAGACSMSMELGSFLSPEKTEKLTKAEEKGDPRDVTGSLPLQPREGERSGGGIHPVDWKLTSTALSEALNQKDEGASIPWSNTQTGSRGTVTPVKAAYIKEGFACRDFLASHIGDGRESWYEGTACRIHRGEWEIRSTRPLEKS